MRIRILLIVGFCFSLFVSGQERFLTVGSKDSINGVPKFKSSLGANIKLNGYYDVFGGLQNNETFNVGAINVFEDDDSGSFKMDMYQTQLKFESSFVANNGKNVYTIVEFDFWGGNGQMRLRKAYVELDHWQIGQSWASFGDEALWPNIMEWEGPPSGVWVRSPHIKYFNTIGGNPDWRFILAIDAPITDYNRYGEIEPLVEEANQNIPDFIAGVKHEKDWGHFRFASILRNVNYKYNDESDSFTGYGFSFSGKLMKNINNFQYQLIGGKGITAYITSIASFGYDGYPNTQGAVEATPSYGGWASYEYYWTNKLHSNIVVGYTRFYSDDVQRILVTNDNVDNVILGRGDVNHAHSYGILNMMYDPFERMTFGVELDYGTKKLEVDGYIDNNYILESKSRDAMRVSFGFMFYF